MNVGMLWFDDDASRTLEEKVSRAADFYRHKYGRPPTLCLINPQAANGRKNVAAVELRTAQNVLPHHFWVGMAENGSAAG